MRAVAHAGMHISMTGDAARPGRIVLPLIVSCASLRHAPQRCVLPHPPMCRCPSMPQTYRGLPGLPPVAGPTASHMPRKTAASSPPALALLLAGGWPCGRLALGFRLVCTSVWGEVPIQQSTLGRNALHASRCMGVAPSESLLVVGRWSSGMQPIDSGHLHCRNMQTTKQQSVQSMSIRRHRNQHQTHPRLRCGPAIRPPCPRPGCPSQRPARGTSDGQSRHIRTAHTSQWQAHSALASQHPARDSSNGYMAADKPVCTPYGKPVCTPYLALHLLPQLLGIGALPLGQPALRVGRRAGVGGIKAAEVEGRMPIARLLRAFRKYQGRRGLKAAQMWCCAHMPRAAEMQCSNTCPQEPSAA